MSTAVANRGGQKKMNFENKQREREKRETGK
jgi:hypothetical protein